MYRDEICILAPSEGMYDNSKAVVRQLGKPIHVFRTNLDIVDKQVEELQKRGAKIFISRLGTKKMIELHNDATVVGVNHTLSDYLEAIDFARDKPRETLAFYVYNGTKEEVDHVADIETMCSLARIAYKIYKFDSVAEAGHAVEKSIVDGVKIGAGGAVTEKAAKAKGLLYFTIENSHKAIEDAIYFAEELLLVKKREEKLREEMMLRFEGFKTVIELTNDAIVSINKQGVIDFANPIAEKVFQQSEQELIGKNIEEVVATTKMLGVLKSGKAITEELLTINDTTVLTNSVPVISGGHTNGVIAKFQDVKIIQKNEQKIRKALSKKGLVAKYRFDDILGNSQALIAAVSIAKGYAATHSTVLIEGESGTGKELFAQGIHVAGERKHEPFVAINCAVLEKNLLESELFGYDEGAFTGAVKGGKIGLFEMAHNGTILLDEIGEMPLELQSKLLRVLQEKEIRRIGSTDVIPIDVRVIASTNRDLRDEVAKGTFRQDLYYRLNVLNLKVPPLRERGEDYVIIANGLYEGHGNRSKFEEVLDRMKTYQWPGNVRELVNFVERVEVLLNIFEEDEAVTQIVDAMYQRSGDAGESIEVAVTPSYGKQEEKERIIAALIASKGAMNEAAKRLNISRSTLWRKRKEYDL